ncbi:MAG: N-6 DNA methylase [Planctomycetia bacterium]|nr:N-6 DNA methylase [Planctomycetia bacterium]
MPHDLETLAHLEWIGYVQPVGLVVSVPALLGAQAQVNRQPKELHDQFLAYFKRDKHEQIIPVLHDFTRFVQDVLGWSAQDLLPAPESCEVTLPNFNETLQSTYVVPYFKPKDPLKKWMMFIQVLDTDTSMDDPPAEEDHHWHASPYAKFERLLREARIPLGLLSNGRSLRLIYAPSGENTGYLTFHLAEMIPVAGRSIFAAMHLLLSSERLFSLPEKQQLPAILEESRKYQSVVSTQLAEQLLAALFELLRGFQAADDQRKGELLKEILADDPHQVYAGLLTVLMRLVFILYAEDRGLLSSDPVYSNFYSVTGLFARLQADAGRYIDTMDQRYGAWAQLLTLFRLIYDGGSHGNLHLPARQGYLFDPSRYPFLEGRKVKDASYDTKLQQIPRVSDGCLLRVLTNLLILDGERLSYLTLGVEQIGGVYETIMGFELEVAKGRSIAIKAPKAHGAPTTINLELLLIKSGADRAKWFTEQTGQKLTGQAAEGLKIAKSMEDMLVALEKKIAKEVTPNVVPAGAMIFQPSEERRRSGSHYTPRTLTGPIVQKTLEPILKQLGDKPKPEQILDLKVCDPAMGSGAFLVEACRQLSEVLVKAWATHGNMPVIPLDETPELFAQRLIAQRCLYGVDKNPMATDLAKLSLWLATLAKDHPFTFLDHAMKCGDSLVGLNKQQIINFHWLPSGAAAVAQRVIEDRIKAVLKVRQDIITSPDEYPFRLKEQKLKKAEEDMQLIRFAGNLAIAAFFAGKNDKERKQKRDAFLQHFDESLRTGIRHEEIRQAETSLRKSQVLPFHWEIEFPEVFTSEKGVASARRLPGFDAIVGNPPFAGKNTIAAGHHPYFLDWLKTLHEESHGNADLVAHFFRRAFNLLRTDGTFGLIATNTIAQGDTRSTGLRWICTNGGTIYHARRRYKWPGLAAVVVSVVHVAKGKHHRPYLLDEKEAPIITAYLFHAGGHDDPARLEANAGKSFIGSFLLGMGFTFDDTTDDDSVNSIELMNKLKAKNKKNAERIFPFIGGEEINNEPSQSPHRYVINFEELDEDEARKWPDLFKIVEAKVKPQRMSQNDAHGKNRWWNFMRVRNELYKNISGSKHTLAINCGATPHLAIAFVRLPVVFSHTAAVFALDEHSSFCSIQSRPHEIWARFLGSSMKDDLRYTPSDCFETFPFPPHFETDATLEAVGKEYYEFRAALMVKNNEGLTKTYNRFHDPNEPSEEIKKLRELHAAMDRAVLDAYGWKDLQPTCEFLLDYEEDDDDEPGVPTTRKKKKPWRYRWPDDFRDEVLARLLELNKQRAEEERLSGEAAEAQAKPKGKRGAKGKKAKDDQQPGLFK